MAQDTYDVIVIGGGYAGVTAANRLPRGTRTALVNPRPDFIHRVRLHEFAAGSNPRIAFPLRKVLRNNVEHHLASATHIEPGLVRLSGGPELRARHILVATGSDRARGNSISSFDAAAETRARLASVEPGQHIAVQGAGLTGIETAAEIAYRRPDLTVSLRGRAPVGDDLPNNVGGYLRRSLESLNVNLDCGGTNDALSIDATGFELSPLAAGSSLDTNSQGHMLVTPTLESAPGVWGAGDAVLIGDLPHLRSSCATAIPLGAHAADNIVRAIRGEPLLPFNFGYAFRCISLGRRKGLITMVDWRDQPTGKFISGLPGAWFKSMICHGVVLAASRLARSYSWPSENAKPC